MTTEPGNGTGKRRQVALALALAAWFGGLYALRFLGIEIEPEADPCLSDPGGDACALRAALGLSIHRELFGTVALLLALGAHLLRARPRTVLATAALFASAVALVLYNVRLGAPATVLALLALAVDTMPGTRARTPSDAAP